MTRSRALLIALSAFVAGTAITAAVMKGLVFTDFTSVVVILGAFAAAILVAAALALAVDTRIGGSLGALAGLVTMLLGVAQIAATGLTYTAPLGGTQPAWLEEFFNIVAGAVIAGMGVGLWRSGEAQSLTSPRQPAA